MDDDWGTLVWLVMTTGIRRGKVCALRWSRVDLDEGLIEIRSSYQLRRGAGREKDTKTHQMRRIALDTETIVLLREHKDRCQRRMAGLGIELIDDMYVFAGVHDFDPRKPYSPTPSLVVTRTWPNAWVSILISMHRGITRLPSS